MADPTAERLRGHHSPCPEMYREAFEEVVIGVVADDCDTAGLDALTALERGAIYLETIYALSDPVEGPYRALIARAALWSPEEEVRFLCAGWCLNRQYCGASRESAGTVAAAVLNSHPVGIRRGMRESHQTWVAGLAPRIATVIEAQPETVRALLQRLRRQPDVVTLPMLLPPADLLSGYLQEPERGLVRRMLVACDQMPTSLSAEAHRRAGALLDDLIRSCPLKVVRSTRGIQVPAVDDLIRIGPWTEWNVSRGYENGPGAEQQETAYVTSSEHRTTLHALGDGVLTLFAANHGRQVRWRVRVRERATLAAPRERGKKRRRRKPAGGG